MQQLKTRQVCQAEPVCGPGFTSTMSVLEGGSIDAGRAFSLCMSVSMAEVLNPGLWDWVFGMKMLNGMTKWYDHLASSAKWYDHLASSAMDACIRR